MGFDSNGIPGSGGAGTGDLTGTLTAGKVPIANGIKSLTDSYIYQSSNVLYLPSDTGQAVIQLSYTDILLNAAGNINASTVSGNISLVSGANLKVGSSTITNGRATYVDSSGYLTTGPSTSGDLANIAGLTSNAQTQLGTKLTGTLTNNYIPVSQGGIVLGNSTISYSGSTLNILSSTAAAAISLTGPNITIGVSSGNLSLTSLGVTNDRVLYINSAGNVVTSIVTSTVLSYIANLTSDAQTQLNGKITNPMTTLGDMIQGGASGAPTRFAGAATGNALLAGGVGVANLWGKIGLTTHVIGILPQANGGSNTSTTFGIGSLVFQGSSSYTEDNTNLNYNSISKTLNVNNLSVVSSSGITGISINSADSLGMSIIAGNGGINIQQSNANSYAINFKSLGTGIIAESIGIAANFSSEFSSAGIFAQTGILAADNATNVFSIYKNLTLGSYTSVGTLLELNDDTAATGNFLSVIKQNTLKLAVTSAGVLQYLDGNQALGKFLTTDASGNASWATPSGGTSYTFSTGLTNASGTITSNLSTGISGGQSVIGGTVASNNLILSSNSSSTKGFIVLGTSVYDEVNNRFGIATGLVVSPYDLAFGPNATRSIGLGRSGVASGNALSINSGSALLGYTNGNAGTLQLMTGTATGNGSGAIEFWVSSGATSGTADAAPITQAKIIGNGNWTFGTNSGGTISVPSARLEVFSQQGTYIQRWNNSSLSGNIGWSFENQTNSGNANIIINEHTSVPNTQPRFKFHAGGSFSIGVTATNADATFHLVGNAKIVDGTQGAGKVYTSDATGLGSWTTISSGITYTGTANRISVTGTVIDISAAYIGQSSITTLGTIGTGTWNASTITETFGGTNQTSYTTGDILYASATNTLSKLGAVASGSYLRSNGTATAPVWSTLKLPNSAAVNQALFATSANNIDSSSEFTYTPSGGTANNQLYIGASVNATSSIRLDNQNGGANVYSLLKLTTSSNEFDISLSGPGNTTGANALLISGSSGLSKFDINNASASVGTRFLNQGAESVRISSSGRVSIKTGADALAILEIGAGISTAAPLKFNAGTNTSTITPGNLEYDGTNLLFSRTSVRDVVLAGTIISGSFTPSTTIAVKVNIAGSTYNLVTA